MDKTLYLPRIIDKQLSEYLSVFTAVCIEGPKWCGKTCSGPNSEQRGIYFDRFHDTEP